MAAGSYPVQTTVRYRCGRLALLSGSVRYEDTIMNSFRLLNLALKGGILSLVMTCDSCFGDLDANSGEWF